jgi:hypothetical protein
VAPAPRAFALRPPPRPGSRPQGRDMSEARAGKVASRDGYGVPLRTEQNPPSLLESSAARGSRMGVRFCLSIAGLAAAGILTATAATRLPPQDTAAQAPSINVTQALSINVNRVAKADRQPSSGGNTIVVKTIRIIPADGPTTALRELPACEASISPLADRLAARHMRRCDT